MTPRKRLGYKEICLLVPCPGDGASADFNDAGYIAHALFLAPLLIDRMLLNSGYDDMARPAWLDEDRNALGALYEISVFAASVRDGTKEGQYET